MAEPMTLMNCPFCGAAPSYYVAWDGPNIGCQCGGAMVWGIEAEIALKWNTRSDATITALQSELRDARERLARVRAVEQRLSATVASMVVRPVIAETRQAIGAELRAILDGEAGR